MILLWAPGAKAIEALSPLLLVALSWLSLQIAAFIDARLNSERLRGVLAKLEEVPL